MKNIDNLIDWFKKNKRDLDWRKNKSPYQVWISEIMLQQTQVNTVIPYYKQWMEYYPNITSLAKASEQDLLKLWQGLGYYSRVKNILKTASILNKKHQSIPDNYKDLLSLPGIGDYTANAILAFAYNREAFVIDGNIERVIARVFSIDKNLKTKEGRQLIKNILKKNLPKKKSALFNESLMELGAKICLSSHPLCSSCPLNNSCIATRDNTTSRFPTKIKKNKSIDIYRIIKLIQNNKDQFLMKKITHQKLFNGLWEFYYHDFINKKDFDKEKKKIDRNESHIYLGYFSHHYTKYKSNCFVYSYNKKNNDHDNWEWIDIKNIEKIYPITSISKKSMNYL